MALETQDTVFSITPPASDIDEFEKTGLLAYSPSVARYCYPSPTPSSQEHSKSVSSDSLYMLPELIMSNPQDHHLHNVSFDAPVSQPSFYPIPETSNSSLSQFAPTSDIPFAMYEPASWYSYPTYPSGQQLQHYGAPQATQFTIDDPLGPPLANIVPPTPREVQPIQFDQLPMPSTIPSHQHLIASPAFSQVSHHSAGSHRSSVSSLSRSCSPTTSSYPALGHEQPGLRQTPRSNSTSSNTSLHAYGIPVHEPTSMPSSSLSPHPQAWRCAFPGCTSRATFTRGCDLRKHYNRHSKHLFCRVKGCPQSEAAASARAKSSDQPLTGGFSSKKDRARHEAKHNPGIMCEWRGPDGEECGRVFSRMDNMKDHVRRIHSKEQPQQQQQQKLQRQSQSSRA